MYNIENSELYRDAKIVEEIFEEKYTLLLKNEAIFRDLFTRETIVWVYEPKVDERNQLLKYKPKKKDIDRLRATLDAYDKKAKA